MCEMFDPTKVLTCSREPVIRLYDLQEVKNDEIIPNNRIISEFIGHDMSVSTITKSTDKTHLVSGSRD